jgi:putative transposase
MREFCSRVHPRWRSHDYAQPGAYFVTTITHHRRRILGLVTERGVLLTEAGRIAHRWCSAVADRFPGVVIDTFVVMPDHVHAIVVLARTPRRTVDVSQVVGWIKQRAAREIAAAGLLNPPIWQRSFHDRIIRDADALVCIRRYIAANPSVAWAERRYR